MTEPASPVIPPEFRTQISETIAAVSVLGETEGQDADLVIEMVQAMLGDLLAVGQLRPMADYVRRYCDVADVDSDRTRIARKILQASLQL